VPIAGHITYRWEPEWVDIADGWIATPKTHATMHGRTAYGDRTDLPFHVTSLDWQESDRLLAGLMTAAGAPARPVAMGGHGTFDGRMTGIFKKPHIEGRFASDDMYAFGVTWGRGTGDLVVDNSYVNVTHGVVTGANGARMETDGLFSLGFDRADGGEEMNATFKATDWPISDLRIAFMLGDWPFDGKASTDVHLNGSYHGPFGAGTLLITDGVAWHEHFQKATGRMEFQGRNMNISGIEMTKSTGTVLGAARIGWDGTYSFTADGEKIPVESLDNYKLPAAPLTGILSFQARGAGAFTAPEYAIDGHVTDFFAGDEEIGQAKGHLEVRGNTMWITDLEAFSTRLAVSGSGHIPIDPKAGASDLQLTVTETSIDPYLRFFGPGGKQFSPYATIVVSGSAHLVGSLQDWRQMKVDATITQADLRLLDYPAQNDGPIVLALDDSVITVKQMKLAGQDTSLVLSGNVKPADRTLGLHATGTANLAILQAFFRNIKSSGAATVDADLVGNFDEPTFLGSATITNGNLRHFSIAHSLDAVNGTLQFDKEGVHVNGLTGQFAKGPMSFGGLIAFSGFTLDHFNLTARGDNMQVRYPTGFLSKVDADLALTGPVSAPLLSGTVEARSIRLLRQLDSAGLIGLFGNEAAGATSADTAPGDTTVLVEPSAFPLSFDIQIRAIPMSFISTPQAHLSGSADLTFHGTLDKPLLSGRLDLDSGEVLFQGNRYVVLRGSIEFNNPTKIDPTFDIEAETHVHAVSQGSSQDYRIGLQFNGTWSHVKFVYTSDPPLPPMDVLALLLGEPVDLQRAEMRAINSAQETELRLVQQVGARLLLAPISEPIGKAAEQALRVDTVSIAPLLGNDQSLQAFNPGARVTLGKRISDKIFLTYSRELNTSQNEVILIEFNQSDRVSWVVSRNEDRTFAIDFRIRHIF
jgi:hypothetical protein